MSKPDPLDCNPTPNLPAAKDLRTLLGVLGYDAKKVPVRKKRNEVDNLLEADSHAAVLHLTQGPEVEFDHLEMALELFEMKEDLEGYPLLVNMVPSLEEAIEIHLHNEGTRFRHPMAQYVPAEYIISPKTVVLATFHHRLAKLTHTEFPEVFDSREVPDEVSRMHREGHDYMTQEFVLRDMCGGVSRTRMIDFKKLQRGELGIITGEMEDGDDPDSFSKWRPWL